MRWIRTPLVVVLGLLLSAVSVADGAGHPHKPRNLVRPSITGEARVGKLLQLHNGSWSPRVTRFRYRWKRCNAAGKRCVTIRRATRKRYRLRSGDRGHRIAVVVAAHDKRGWTTATSKRTKRIGAAATGAKSTAPGPSQNPTSQNPAGGAVNPGGSGGSAPVTSRFPLQVSANGRYLETAQGSPWLMVGDSPQSTIGDLSVAKSDAYFADRAAHGFNAVWTNLLCESYTECSGTGVTYDGVKPFTTGTDQSSYDLSTPNGTYFARAHQMVADAEADGIEVLLDPAPTDNCNSGSWMTTLENNGNGTVSTTNKDYQYGEYLGRTFKDLPNIIWFSGNDFSCYGSQADNNDAISVANGIKATDPTALQTTELNIGHSESADDWSNWQPTLGINGAYTYEATYGIVREAYLQTKSSPTELPVFMEEANYEGQQLSGADGCLENDNGWRHCREQEWWTMTSGATGQLYGGPCYGMDNSTGLSTCDTTGVTQLGYVTQLMDQIDWWKLVPDGNWDGSGRVYVTSGGGTTCPDWQYTTFDTNNCITDATIPDGAGIDTLIAYYPDPSSFGTITVNMSKFTGPVTARWYDPTDGGFTTVSGSPFTNSGSHAFAPSTNNSAGDKDWVLLLQS